MEKRGRIPWIDVAKGICMISVIAGHMGVKPINNVVYSYHLTVFFILSGYTLKNNLSIENVTKKFKSLMGPYFTTCVAVAGMDIVNRILLKGETDFLTITRSIGYDLLRSFLASGTIKNFGPVEVGGRIGAIWFLPATFFAVLIAQIMLKYVADLKHRYAVTISLAVLSCVSAQFIWLPFSVQSACLAAPLVLLGYDLKQNGILDRLSLRDVLACLFVFSGGILLKKTPIYYVTASMSDYVISIVCALASSTCVIYIAQKMEGSKTLAWIGRNSIYYLCVHLFEMETMGAWFSKLLAAINLPVNSGTLFVVKFLFVTAVTCLILCKKRLARSGDEIQAVQGTRDTALDVAKAVLIVLMIIGHFSVGEQFRSIVYSFHMVAFIFYSGYCFRPESGCNLVKAVKKQMKGFLIPYALFGFGYVLLTHDGIEIELKRLVFGLSFTKNLFADVGSIGPVYFILLLFVTKVVYLFIERFVPEEKWKALIVLALSLIGQLLGEKGYWLPWSADCALYALIFYYLGHCFKKYGIMEYLCERSYYYFVLSSVWAYMIYKGSMEIAIRNYGTYGLTVLGAVSASVLLYMACRYICSVWNGKLIGLICQVGKNTLYILIVHKLLSGTIGKFVSLQFTRGSVYYATAVVLLQLAAGVLLGNMITWVKRKRPAVLTQR